MHSDLQLSLALGQLSEGVTNLELTAAYAALAGGGVYRQPRFYTKVVDRAGNILLENKMESSRIIKEETAWLLTDTMQEVISDGDAKEAKFDRIKTSAAGYSGKTSGNTDFWFEGYTPYYTAGIWSGMDENLSQEDSNYHMVIWKEIMEQVHEETKKTKGCLARRKRLYQGKSAISVEIWQLRGFVTKQKEVRQCARSFLISEQSRKKTVPVM